MMETDKAVIECSSHIISNTVPSDVLCAATSAQNALASGVSFAA